MQKIYKPAESERKKDDKRAKVFKVLCATKPASPDFDNFFLEVLLIS
jgi:protein-disulfide isomerase